MVISASHFRNWLSTLDQDKLIALADIKSWIFLLGFNFLIIVAASWVPLTSEFFKMAVEWPLLMLALMSLGALLEVHPKVKDWLSYTGYGILRMLVGSTVQLSAWIMVVSSSEIGGVLLAAPAILITAYHGQFFQVSVKYPYGLILTAIALTGAFLLDSQGQHMPVLILGGLICVGASFVMGGNEIQRLKSLIERDALQQAVDAQILYERTREVETVQSTIKEIRGTNHDAGNVLSGILMNLQFLTSRLKSKEGGLQSGGDMVEITDDLNESVHRLRQLIEQGQNLGHQTSQYEAISLREVVAQTVDEYRRLFPTKQLFVEDGLENDISLALPGGELTLSRILSNLIRNACEGEGVNSATEVRVCLIPDSEASLEIKVCDNGPGFTEDQLNKPFSQFTTTKAQGGGLGIYTTHRLVAACKGQLVLANGRYGGAEVSAIFPLSN